MANLKRTAGHLTRTPTGHLAKCGPDCSACVAPLMLCRCMEGDYVRSDYPDLEIVIGGSSSPLGYRNSATSNTCPAPGSCPDVSGTYIIACNDTYGESQSVFVCNDAGNPKYFYVSISIEWDVDAANVGTASISISSGIANSATGGQLPASTRRTLVFSTDSPGMFDDFQFEVDPLTCPESCSDIVQRRGCPSSLSLVSDTWLNQNPVENACDLNGVTVLASLL